MRSTLLALVALGSSACFTFVDFELGNSGAAGQGGAGAAGLGGVGGLGGAGASGLGGEGGSSSVGMGGMSACGLGFTSCDAGCVNTDIDVAHCGACSHDCGGGECVQGECREVELASYPAMHGLLLDDARSRVFFATSNFGRTTNVVGAVSKQGGPPEVFSATQPAASYLAMTGSNLYFTTWDQPSVRRINLSQPVAVPSVEVAVNGPCFGIQPIGNDVYAGNYDLGLFRFNPTAVVTVPVPKIRHFLSDANSMVFTVGQPTSSVTRYFPNGMLTEQLTTANDAWDIVQDAGYYYFSDQGNGSLRRIVKPATVDGPTELMASGLGGARGLALDDDYVYVVSGSAVTRVDKDSPFATTPVAGAIAGNQIAVDENFIYWTNIGSGKLMKIAKPI